MRPAILAALLLSGCAGAPKDAITARFACDTGETITVVFTAGHARLTDPQGRTADLVQQRSGSGYIYQGDGHGLRGKGREATWTHGDAAPRVCHEAG